MSHGSYLYCLVLMKHVLKLFFVYVLVWLFEPINFQDGEAYAYLLNALAPEHASRSTLDAKDPKERANMVLEQAEKLECKRYLTPTDIVEGSPNLNLAFVAQIFQHRCLIYQFLVYILLFFNYLETVRLLKPMVMEWELVGMTRFW